MNAAMKWVNLGLGSLLVGVMLVIWLMFNPSGLSAAEFLERQQAMIRLLNTPMPILGAATIALALWSAGLRRRDRGAFIPLLIAAVLFAGAGVITRFCNQPINAQVMTWNANEMPANWESLRDEWWRWHIMRTVLAVVALALLIAGHGRHACPLSSDR
jgi:uncharacterized membrane protein